MNYRTIGMCIGTDLSCTSPKGAVNVTRMGASIATKEAVGVASQTLATKATQVS